MTRIDQIRSMLSSEPNDAFLNYALAIEMEKEGELENAITQLQYLKEIDSSYLPLYYKLAELYTLANNFLKAKEIYQTGIEIAQKQNNAKTLKELKEALFNLEMELE